MQDEENSIRMCALKTTEHVCFMFSLGYLNICVDFRLLIIKEPLVIAKTDPEPNSLLLCISKNYLHLSSVCC